jgi:methionine-rich copper-binding protein CopC
MRPVLFSPDSNLSRAFTLLISSLLLLFCLLAASPVLSQHGGMFMGSSSGVELESIPADDEVLAQAPIDLILRFSTYVRLVKLTLKAADGNVVEIGFRYNPELSRVFFWDLPPLPEKDYYAVEWAAVDTDNQIARGSFNFTFGPDAKTPSELIPDPEVLDPVIVPDFRLIDQSL